MSRFIYLNDLLKDDKFILLFLYKGKLLDNLLGSIGLTSRITAICGFVPFVNFGITSNYLALEIHK